jgi:hypothetical protein
MVFPEKPGTGQVLVSGNLRMPPLCVGAVTDCDRIVKNASRKFRNGKRIVAFGKRIRGV